MDWRREASGKVSALQVSSDSSATSLPKKKAVKEEVNKIKVCVYVCMEISQ
jgi:hypothetical protein